MHELRPIKVDPGAFDAQLRRRGYPPSADAINAADAAWRRDDTLAQEMRARANEIAKLIGGAKRSGQPTTELENEARRLREKLPGQDADALAHETARQALLEALPNLLDSEVPDGADETANLVLQSHGEPPVLDFAPKQHFELGEALGLMDFAAAAKIAGSRFTVLRGALARLERALGQYMLDLHTTEHGYTEISPPLLVNEATAFGSGQLPKFADDLFRTTDGRYLIPTSEMPLANLVAGDILAERDLPLRFTALTPCFRSEAGSAGRDTRGMLRQHQFQKVELIAVTTPAQSDAELDRMTGHAERVLTELGLTWRRVFLCAGDTGFSAARTYDLEVWLPGQGAWREISSCSNTRAFQARRMKARYRPAQAKGTEFVHTLNGSGVAVGRALIAVLETHQQADGSVVIPEPLRPYLGGMARLG